MDRKKIIATLTAAVLAFGLGACGTATGTTGDDTASGSTSRKTQESKPEPADLTGTWKQTNGNSDDTWMEAVIGDGTIEVDWVTGDTRSLYWKGTFEAPTEAGDWTWTSQGDTDAMGKSLMGSQDSTKEFTYTEKDGISWQVSALGTTTTVNTTKQ